MFDLNYNPKLGNFDIVAYYRKCGLNVMPLRVDGTKAPKIKWSEYQLENVPAFLLRRHFDTYNSGIGVICGVTSGNLELLDFDDPGIFAPWLRAVSKRLSGVFGYAPLIATPSDGRHLFYRCETIAGNLKLAYNADREIAIETRGQGGQAVLPGGPPGVHVTGQPYRLIGGSFGRIPTITPAQRQIVLEVSRGFDATPPKPEPVDIEKVYGVKLTPSDAGDRPGDDFNVRGEWEDILVPKDWTMLREVGDVAYWRRPGKEGTGPSATTGYCGNHLHVFSSNASPFEADQTYSKFAAFSMLWCGGDFRHAAEHLSRIGYGGIVAENEDKINSIVERYYK
jgi:putative DNA primase/helicase